MPVIEQPDMPREILRAIHEHEILLAFRDDPDAVMFQEWWNVTGWRLFEAWATQEKAERPTKSD